MFIHRDKRRTFAHNLRLASLLSFIAGNVNIIGFFMFYTLTTNVTGHFAFFGEAFVFKQFQEAWTLLGFIFCFLLGAFISGLLIESLQKSYPRHIHIIPLFIEISILASVIISPDTVLTRHTNIFACALLFAMGLQNALVTNISNAVVRTTHLTGLFTDLGIEFSQLFFYRKKEDVKSLITSIRLRLAIVIFFLTGCIVGGYSFLLVGKMALIIAIACLIIALLFDLIRYKMVYKRISS